MSLLVLFRLTNYTHIVNNNPTINESLTVYQAAQDLNLNFHKSSALERISLYLRSAQETIFFVDFRKNNSLE